MRERTDYLQHYIFFKSDIKFILQSGSRYTTPTYYALYTFKHTSVYITFLMKVLLCQREVFISVVNVKLSMKSSRAYLDREPLTKNFVTFERTISSESKGSVGKAEAIKYNLR